jgi:plasmid segregation protein ParM
MCDVLLGVDDGFEYIKIDEAGSKQAAFQSRAALGGEKRIHIGAGFGADTIQEYVTDDAVYQIGDIDNALPTRYDDYPVSSHNRALVVSALERAGYAGKKVEICTGLPLRTFYSGGGEPNKLMIHNKRENLLKNDVRNAKGEPILEIVAHEVIAECVATYLDYVVSDTEDGGVKMNSDRLKDKIAIVDIGGRTTDIVVVENWSVKLDQAATMDVGMLSARQSLSEKILVTHDVTVSDKMLISAMKTGYIKIYGRQVDVRGLVHDSLRDLLQNIKTKVKQVIGKGVDIDCVIMTGGGAQSLSEALTGWYPRQIIASNPQFSNAKGMRKFLQLKHQG